MLRLQAPAHLFLVRPLLPHLAPHQAPAFLADAETVVGLAAKGITELANPAELIDLCVDAFQALGKAFTHKRTVSVAVETSTALAARFERLEEYKDDGVEFGWEHTDVGMVMTYHNDGPISGCQGFHLPDCGWQLFVSASNPLVGHNKARVAFVAPDSGRTCYKSWDDMDSWGETEGNVDKNDYWDTYDNPSTISFKLRDVPAECVKGGMNASKVFQV